jgi:hypothetical protein
MLKSQDTCVTCYSYCCASSEYMFVSRRRKVTAGTREFYNNGLRVYPPSLHVTPPLSYVCVVSCRRKITAGIREYYSDGLRVTPPLSYVCLTQAQHNSRHP